MSSELQEDMQYIQAVLSKIMFKLVVCLVILGQVDNNKVNIVISELQHNELAGVEKILFGNMNQKLLFF